MSEQLGMKEGMRAVDERVESVLAENKATEAAEARVDAIESRATSKEVAALNDTAELEIFGSRGRTYTDPTTGDVIASAEKPMVGKIDSILTDYKYGATENERRQAAETYQNRLEELLNNEGLELSQAKLVLDAEDPIDLQKRRGEAIGRRMAAGQSDEEARNQVDAQFAKLSEQRVARIRDGGVFTAEEYELVKKGKDLYAEPRSASDPTPADAPATTPDAPATPDAPVNPDDSVNYKDLTKDQKEEFTKDVEGLIRGINQSYGTAEQSVRNEQLTKLRESLMRDGGITEAEAYAVIRKANHRIETSAAAAPVDPVDAPVAAPDTAPSDPDYLLPDDDPVTPDAPAADPADTTPDRTAVRKDRGVVLGWLSGRVDWAKEKYTNMENRRLKLALGGVAAVAAGVLAWRLTGDHTFFSDAAQTVATNKTGALDNALNSIPDPTEQAAHGAWNVVYNDGLLKVFQEHGIASDKLTPEVTEHLKNTWPDWFKAHGSDTWIMQKGTLPADAVKYMSGLK